MHSMSHLYSCTLFQNLSVLTFENIFVSQILCELEMLFLVKNSDLQEKALHHIRP